MPNLNEVSEERVSQIVGVAGLLVTLAILPGPNYDPINPIKVLICCGLGFAALGLVYSNKYLRKRLAGRVLWLVVALHGWMFLVLFLSGAPLAQQLFGVFGRNTGIVTYLGLSAFLLAAYSVRNNLDIRRIINYLVVAGTFEVLYGFVQAVGKDPIKWSSQDTFGTLGNINFHSAMVAISASVLLVRISEKNLSQIMRCFLIALEIAHLCMLAINGSFQGQAIFAIIVLFFIPTLIASSQIPKKKFYFISSVLILLLAISLGLAGILKTGPLSKYIYQETILYRADYWHAGFAMTLLKPFFGVGIDSYGDWYRQTRGEISTLRTGPDRISNSAHNLILDFSSGEVSRLRYFSSLWSQLQYGILIVPLRLLIGPIAEVLLNYLSHLAGSHFSYSPLSVSIKLELEFGVGSFWDFCLAFNSTHQVRKKSSGNNSKKGSRVLRKVSRFQQQASCYRQLLGLSEY